MRPLLKVMVILAAVFASTFILGRIFGILTEANVRAWLQAASETSPDWIVAVVFLLLFIDLFVAIPTMTVTILAGYFLGFPLALAASLAGVSAAALTGYLISLRFGDRVIRKLVADPQQRDDLTKAFHKNGPVMILLSRAAPIVPEVTACMAGATRMPPTRYATFFLLSTLPYVAVASYAGSVSTFDDPRPAIFAAIVLYGVLWIGWAMYRRRMKAKP